MLKDIDIGYRIYHDEERYRLNSSAVTVQVYVLLGRRTIESNGHRLLLDALKPVGVGRCDGIPKYPGIFQLGTE
jgi:hypothetical protein